MPSDDMDGGLPYRDARGTVLFDNHSKLVCGFLPELYERLCHGGVLGQVLEVSHFPGSKHCRGPFAATIIGIRWRQARLTRTYLQEKEEGALQIKAEPRGGQCWQKNNEQVTRECPVRQVCAE
jgi:hypothetical protein